MPEIILDLKDVTSFFRELVNEGVNAHPDDDFNNYINVNTGLLTFTTAEAEIRNMLMNKCFEICREANVDIYSLMQEVFLIETGLYKFIPLPFQT